MKKALLLAAMFVAAGVATAQQKYNIYLGNTHSHCNFSGDIVAAAQKAGRELDPKNDVDQCIIAAREAGYQFYCVTDHSQYDCYTPQAWTTVGEWTNKLTEDGKFVALRGFEYSRNDNTDGSGHMNVYNTPDFVSAAKDAYDLHKFQDWLMLPENKNAVVSFNHPDSLGYNDFAIYNEAVKPKFTMFEVINSDHPKYYGRYLHTLALGFKVSPVAGIDNHNYRNIPKAVSRTGVAATELTQAGVLEAFAARRTYATMDKELKIFYTVNDQPMGSTLVKPKKGDLKFVIEASTSAAHISKIEIVGEMGKVITSKDFAPDASGASGDLKWAVPVPQGQEYYFLVVYKADGPVAWVAPVWVE